MSIHLIFLFFFHHTHLDHGDFTVKFSLYGSFFAIGVSLFNVIASQPNEFDPILMSDEMRKRMLRSMRKGHKLDTTLVDVKKDLLGPIHEIGEEEEKEEEESNGRAQRKLLERVETKDPLFDDIMENRPSTHWEQHNPNKVEYMSQEVSDGVNETLSEFNEK